MNLPYNPFNPLKTYRIYQTYYPNQQQEKEQKPKTKHKSQQQQSTYTLLLRNQESKGLKSDQNFNTYINTLRLRHTISKSLIQKHKSNVELQNLEQDQEKKTIIASTSNKSHRRNKITHQITEMINEIKSPNYKKARYLVNEDKDREKKLDKPLFFGIQNQAKQNIRKKQIYSQVDVGKLRQKIFFDDYNPFHLKTTSQYSQADSQLQTEQIKDFFND